MLDSDLGDIGAILSKFADAAIVIILKPLFIYDFHTKFIVTLQPVNYIYRRQSGEDGMKTYSNKNLY